MKSHKCPVKKKHLYDSTMERRNRRAVHLMSVFDDFRILVFCCHFQLLLLFHIAVSSHRTQVATVDCQQNHRRRKSPIANVSQALSSHHDEDPKRTGIKVGSMDFTEMSIYNVYSMSITYCDIFYSYRSSYFTYNLHKIYYKLHKI